MAMKQQKAARKAATAVDMENVLYRKWARGSRCPYCRNLFDTRQALASHLDGRCNGDPRVVAERMKTLRSGPVDPRHPERGRMYKGSLLASMLAASRKW